MILNNVSLILEDSVVSGSLEIVGRCHPQLQ